MTLTSFPRCTCPNGRPLWEVGEKPLDCRLPLVSCPLRLLCHLKRTQRSVLVELGRPRHWGVEQPVGDKLEVNRSRQEISLSQSDGNWDSGPRGPRRMRSVNSPPQFKLPNYQVSIAENQPAGATVITLEAHDPDEGEAGRLTYSMEAFF
uniref:Cadherin domain-containing protein n=1 Tax=Micrurus spixii TaxID=129469 RepID=A0A2D4LFR5_9SAUR